MNFRLFTLCAFAAICFVASAQYDKKQLVFAADSLSAARKTELQIRAKQKVEEFQYYLGKIANPKIPDIKRQNAIKSALALFIGEGDAYSVQDDEGDVVMRESVKMQISSTRTNSISKKLIKTYLNDQYRNIHNYTEVNITSADVVMVDKIYRVGEGRYQAVVHFCQKYISYRGEKAVYKDITTKSFIVYISVTETPFGCIIWDAKLGDVYATETQRI